MNSEPTNQEPTVTAYIRQSSNPADPKPYQVRRNRPDQTFVVLARFASAAAAYAAAERANAR